MDTDFPVAGSSGTNYAFFNTDTVSSSPSENLPDDMLDYDFNDAAFIGLTNRNDVSLTDNENNDYLDEIFHYYSDDDENFDVFTIVSDIHDDPLYSSDKSDYSDDSDID